MALSWDLVVTVTLLHSILLQFELLHSKSANRKQLLLVYVCVCLLIVCHSADVCLACAEMVLTSFTQVEVQILMFKKTG